MSMPQLRLASFGYVLYAIRGDGRCKTMGAPVVPTLPHRCDLLIRSLVPATPGLDISSDGDGGSIVHLRNCDVSFLPEPPGSPAAETRDFDLVPKFTSLVCGVSLDGDWRNATGLDVKVDFPGGVLTAAADGHTNEAQWSWEDCEGQEVYTRLTSLTVYEIELAAPRITIRARPGGGSHGEISLPQEDVTVAFRSLPITDVPEGREHVVDLAHISSTMDLCEITGGPRVMLGERHVDPGNLPQPKLPEDVRKFLDLGPRVRGRPNCGARQMADG